MEKPFPLRLKHLDFRYNLQMEFEDKPWNLGHTYRSFHPTFFKSQFQGTNMEKPFPLRLKHLDFRYNLHMEFEDKPWNLGHTYRSFHPTFFSISIPRDKHGETISTQAQTLGFSI